VHVPDAASAMERLGAGEKIAFVLSDIVMPGDMNGLDLARALRQRFPHLPILLTSGYSEAAHAAGTTFPILRKPFELAELDRAVRAVVAAISRSGRPPRRNLR
jgi:CheY-like chemotaxis protein